MSVSRQQSESTDPGTAQHSDAARRLRFKQSDEVKEQKHAAMDELPSCDCRRLFQGHVRSKPPALQEAQFPTNAVDPNTIYRGDSESMTIPTVCDLETRRHRMMMMKVFVQPHQDTSHRFVTESDRSKRPHRSQRFWTVLSRFLVDPLSCEQTSDLLGMNILTKNVDVTRLCRPFWSHDGSEA